MNVLYEIPNNYRIVNRNSEQAYLRDFEHFFYANLDSTITDTDFDDWQMDLYNAQGLVEADVAPLIKDIITGSEFRFYSEFTIPLTVDIGTGYYFVIFNNLTDDIKFVTNCFRVIGDDEIIEYVLLNYRNSTNMFNYNYETLTQSNNLFMRANLIDAQPETELRQYKSAATGDRRNVKSQTDRVITLETYFFDDETNKVMVILGVHDEITLNAGSFTVKSAHSVESNKFNSVQKGTMEFFDDTISEINL